MRPRGRFKCKNNALGIYYKNNFDHLLIKSSSHIIFDFTLLFITLYYLNIPFITFSTSSNGTFSIRIIRKTKRFAIPERAVYFLKTKRTAGVLPHPKNFRPAYAGIHIMQERSPDTIRTPFFSFCRFAPAFRASRHAASLNALYAATLCALTSLPRKARREPTFAYAFEAPPSAFASDNPPFAYA